MSKARKRVVIRSKARRRVRHVAMMGKVRRGVLMRSKVLKRVGAQARNNDG